MITDYEQTAQLARGVAESEDIIETKRRAFAELAANTGRPRDEREFAWGLALALDAIAHGLDATAVLAVAAPPRRTPRTGSKKALTREISRGRIRKEPKFGERKSDPLSREPRVEAVTELA